MPKGAFDNFCADTSTWRRGGEITNTFHKIDRVNKSKTQSDSKYDCQARFHLNLEQRNSGHQK